LQLLQLSAQPRGQPPPHGAQHQPGRNFMPDRLRCPEVDDKPELRRLLDRLADEVASARIWAGFHYRFSTRVGTDLGRKIGNYVVQHAMQPLTTIETR
jgi:hypothetical protein